MTRRISLGAILLCAVAILSAPSRAQTSPVVYDNGTNWAPASSPTAPS